MAAVAAVAWFATRGPAKAAGPDASLVAVMPFATVTVGVAKTVSLSSVRLPVPAAIVWLAPENKSAPIGRPTSTVAVTVALAFAATQAAAVVTALVA